MPQCAQYRSISSKFRSLCRSIAAAVAGVMLQQLPQRLGSGRSLISSVHRVGYRNRTRCKIKVRRRGISSGGSVTVAAVCTRHNNGSDHSCRTCRGRQCNGSSSSSSSCGWRCPSARRNIPASTCSTAGCRAPTPTDASLCATYNPGGALRRCARPTHDPVRVRHEELRRQHAGRIAPVSSPWKARASGQARAHSVFPAAHAHAHARPRTCSSNRQMRSSERMRTRPVVEAGKRRSAEA